jgi:hypothetical protein
MTRANVRIDRPQCFRVWIVRCDNWQPRRWQDVPPVCVAVEPAAETCLTQQQATFYVRNFNEEMLVRGESLWAVAVPVVPRFDGDLTPGQFVASRPLRLARAVTKRR